jgi:hypothetical protein
MIVNINYLLHNTCQAGDSTDFADDRSCMHDNDCITGHKLVNKKKGLRGDNMRIAEKCSRYDEALDLASPLCARASER